MAAIADSDDAAINEVPLAPLTRGCRAIPGELLSIFEDGNPPQPQLSVSTSSTMTKVEAGGFPSTSSSSSLAPLISAAFSSDVTDAAPGAVPSRVTWMVTMGMFVVLGFGDRRR
jgi:hypothetical protein